MGQRYRQLSFEERRTIFRLPGARVPVAEIAAHLGRHRSTIYREIGHNMPRPCTISVPAP